MLKVSTAPDRPLGILRLLTEMHNYDLFLPLKLPPSSDQASSLDQRASLQTPWTRDGVMQEFSQDTTGMPTTKCKRWQILQNEKNALRFLQQIHCKGIQTCQSKRPVWDFTSGNLMSRCPRTRRGTIRWPCV